MPQLPQAPPPWLTGTLLDEFLPIYVALARPTAHHAGYSQAEVDAMDIAVVAAVLKAGADPRESEKAAAMDLTKRRMLAAKEGRTLTHADLAELA